jgi:hypothetical protein
MFVKAKSFWQKSVKRIALIPLPFWGRIVSHHHQPINVPNARAQAFLMDYPQGERANVRIGENREWYVKIGLFHTASRKSLSLLILLAIQTVYKG